MNKLVEWAVRLPGSLLLLYAFFQLYSRPLTHSYHKAFLFNHLQVVLWVMLALIMALVVQSFTFRTLRWWLSLLLAVALLLPYPWVHQHMLPRAGAYYFHQRRQVLDKLNQQIIQNELDEVAVYDKLSAVGIRDFEVGEGYVAYWVERIPEQRDGLVYLREAPLPDRLFQFPVRVTIRLSGRWYMFSSEPGGSAFVD